MIEWNSLALRMPTIKGSPVITTTCPAPVDQTLKSPQDEFFMPILAAEPALFPPQLFDAATELGGRRWFVLHTRPRQEKSTARDLHVRRMPFFLPLISKRLKIRGRFARSHLPLFSGYLFLLGSAEDEFFARSARRVARCLDVTDQARMWDDLRQIQRLIESGVPMRPEDQLTPGAPVEIRSGPLAGLHGVIVKSATGNRFIVKVDFIQRGASVMLDESDLARVLE
jgi:transcriptional antiterminator RfaH